MFAESSKTKAPARQLSLSLPFSPFCLSCAAHCGDVVEKWAGSKVLTRPTVFFFCFVFLAPSTSAFCVRYLGPVVLRTGSCWARLESPNSPGWRGRGGRGSFPRPIPTADTGSCACVRVCICARAQLAGWPPLLSCDRLHRKHQFVMFCVRILSILAAGWFGGCGLLLWLRWSDCLWTRVGVCACVSGELAATDRYSWCDVVHFPVSGRYFSPTLVFCFLFRIVELFLPHDAVIGRFVLVIRRISWRPRKPVIDRGGDGGNEAATTVACLEEFQT